MNVFRVVDPSGVRQNKRSNETIVRRVESHDASPAQVCNVEVSIWYDGSSISSVQLSVSNLVDEISVGT